ncbi:hypothetical protein BGX38DRAFT_1049730, partial [Terfezia claveryi]
LRRICLHPPLTNSSSPWATSLEHLSALYSSPFTGAITTRTSLTGPKGFPHDPTIHQYTFLSPQSAPLTSDAQTKSTTPPQSDTRPHLSSPFPVHNSGAVNTFGYSPYPLSYYLGCLSYLPPPPREAPIKPVIISITGSPEDIISGLESIYNAAEGVPSHMPLWAEINLSCPNIPDKPPPAYDIAELTEYLHAVASWRNQLKENRLPVEKIKIGIKTSPYTYLGQFQMVVGALAAAPDVIDFITACNTLGTSLSFLPTEGDYLLGGLSGPSLHPLALGNVYTLRKLLDEYGSGELSDVGIIGVGGVCDGRTFGAMRRAGADVVGVGVGVG